MLTKAVSSLQPQKALKCTIFHQQSPEFAVLVVLIYAHLDFFFFLVFVVLSEQDDLCRGVSGETEKHSHYKKKDRKNGLGACRAAPLL